VKLLSSCRWEIFWSISRVGEDRTCLTSHRDGGEIPPSCVPDWNLLAQCIEAVGVRAPWPADAWKVNNRRLEVSTTVSPQLHSLARRTCTHVTCVRRHIIGLSSHPIKQLVHTGEGSDNHNEQLPMQQVCTGPKSKVDKDEHSGNLESWGFHARPFCVRPSKSPSRGTILDLQAH